MHEISNDNSDNQLDVLQCQNQQLTKSFIESFTESFIEKQSLFPNEQQAFYYVASKSDRTFQKVSKEKLLDLYSNTVDECRQIELLPKKKRKRTDKKINDSDIESHIIPESIDENLFIFFNIFFR